MNFLKLAVLALTAFSFSVFAESDELLQQSSDELLQQVEERLNLRHHHCNSDSGDPVSPLPEGVKLNKYKLLLTVGADEELILNPLTVGVGGFSTIFNLDSAQIETVRQAAIAWFLERFGIDFTAGVYDPVSGVTSTASALLVPLSFEGTYRVLSSNNHHIPTFGRHHPTLIRLAQYVVLFLTPPTYTGTYASAGPVLGSLTDGVSYGIYRVFTDKNQNHGYNFFMRSYYPSTTEPIADPIPRMIERFQMYSSKWGPGFGVLHVGVATAPINGKYPTYLRGSWSFPGSFVLPDYNTFTTPPLNLN